MAGNLEAVKVAIAKGAKNKSKALWLASTVEIVKYFVDNKLVTDDDIKECLRIANLSGKLGIVKYLFENMDIKPKMADGDFIVDSFRSGNNELVDYNIARVRELNPPNFNISQIIISAVFRKCPIDLTLKIVDKVSPLLNLNDQGTVCHTIYHVLTTRDYTFDQVFDRIYKCFSGAYFSSLWDMFREEIVPRWWAKGIYRTISMEDYMRDYHYRHHVVDHHLPIHGTLAELVKRYL